ncbi:MAG: virulence RhuM family protein, partial [Deltaproteobacteria bacterium]|nr:virulence RhuM family protein [Deltaproteobacteria bacterium]
DGKVTVDVFFAQDNFWLTQKTMGELFGVNKSAISKHLKNIYESGELTQAATVSKMETVQTEGERRIAREVEFYNLDAVIAVGYRVNSVKATHFRIWATNTLREFVIKGFVINDQMLKNGRAFGKDYFDELLEKIREIRASERRAYQKIADVFEQCSSDYRSNSEETRLFYQIVQNQLHFATTGKTAAEIVFQRADSEKPFMGLTTWKNSPKGKVLKSDVTVAKNYLNREEVSKLNRLVTMFIDFAELRALNHQIMTMKDWLTQVERFLNFTDQQILRHAGKISHEMAIAKAHEEYEKFRIKQDREYLSDFDQTFARYLKGEDKP